jgi:hypothetical protein
MLVVDVVAEVVLHRSEAACATLERSRQNSRQLLGGLHVEASDVSASRSPLLVHAEVLA